MFNFEKLQVWQKSIALAGQVYALTKTFPIDERFGLTNQMRRAAVSISSNIAEGCSRESKADFSRFIGIATGSAFELVSQARIARDQELLSPTAHDLLYRDSLEIVRMLTGLRDSLKE
ncbi:four helix bundle protein [Oleiharenicola lentus]|uniref:four helix bundle protein n=1 Tax=Oleiharenicola lentus TaxID=2508720 RepID=UPI003F680C9C